MSFQITIPVGKEVMNYEEFAKDFGFSVRTVEKMVADGDLLLMPRKHSGSAARINMVAFRARLLQQGINCRYVAA